MALGTERDSQSGSSIDCRIEAFTVPTPADNIRIKI
jgi:hypothetical protein